LSVFLLFLSITFLPGLHNLLHRPCRFSFFLAPSPEHFCLESVQNKCILFLF
jgi:hypothetical protein